MRKILFLLVLTFYSVCVADDSLLFRADFDAFSVTADYAGGGRESTTFKNPSLQLRMWKGIDGKGNALALEKSERCAYPLDGNFNPKQGTVSFWVAPLNWKPGDHGFQWFFTASQPDFTMHVYKYVWPNCLFFYISSSRIPGDNKRLSAKVHIRDEDWGENVWHKIDAVWDRTGMKLYVDGVLPKKVKWLDPVVHFTAPVDFPDAASGSIALNNEPSQREEDKYQRTAFDNLRIYNRPLSSAEVYDEYAKYRTSTFGSDREVPILPIPEEKIPVTLDGKIDPDEWLDASIAPVMEKAPVSRYTNAKLRGRAYLKHDGEKLKIAFLSDCPVKSSKHTEADAELWQDDSIELHFMMPDKSYCQLILNGNGALFDAKDKQTTWDSKAAIAVMTASDSWSLEIEIPFATLGGRPEKANFYLVEHGQQGLTALAWSCPSGQDFFSPNRFGKLIYANEVFGIEEIGMPENGELALKIRSSGEKTHAAVKLENGTSVDFQGKLPTDTWELQLPAGKQKIVVRSERDGEVTGFYEHYYYVNFPIEVKYDNMPYLKKTAVTVNLSGAGAKFRAKLKDGIGGKIRIVRKNDDKVMAENEVMATDTVSSYDIPLPVLPQGEYYIVASFGGFTGKKHFNVPNMTPFEEPRVGVDDTVPPPWTPITISGEKTYAVLDRFYTFGVDPFPVRLISRGSDMFFSPPVLTVDGKQPAWSDFKQGKHFPDRVLFSGKGTVDGWIIHWKGQLWFDGMYKVSLETEGKRKISEMTLTYSVPLEFARYVFKQEYRYQLFNWENGRIEKRFDPLKHRENTLQWTSGVEMGLAFAPESNKNWANSPDEKNIILTRNDQSVTVMSKIISRPVEVNGVLDYTFVFQGTPSRRPHPETRDINNNGYRVPTMQNLQFGSGGDHTFADYDTPVRWTSPASMKPRSLERYALHVQQKKKAWQTSSRLPFRSVNYCMPMHIGTNEPEYDFFINDWITLPTCVWSYADSGVPQTLFSVCGNTEATDVLIWNLEQLFKIGGLDGIYNDCAHTPACENPRHGHGGIDAFGQRFSTSSMLSQREYFLREYKLVRKYDKFLFNHIPAADFVPFVHEFSDLIWPGEEFHQSVLEHTDYHYVEFIQREAWQSAFSSVIRGVAVSLLPQYGRAAAAMPKEKREAGRYNDDPEWAIRTLTPLLVHDVLASAANIDPKTVDKWWIIKEPLNLNKAVFHGYWFDDTIKSSTENMLVSWYELPPDVSFRYLIIAGNFNRHEAPAGIGKLPFEHRSIQELWIGEEITEQELKTMKIPGNHFRLFGVK
jgi:hypothetical protein